jgi:hypothetical protein
MGIAWCAGGLTPFVCFKHTGPPGRRSDFGGQLLHWLAQVDRQGAMFLVWHRHMLEALELLPLPWRNPNVALLELLCFQEGVDDSDQQVGQSPTGLSLTMTGIAGLQKVHPQSHICKGGCAAAAAGHPHNRALFLKATEHAEFQPKWPVWQRGLMRRVGFNTTKHLVNPLSRTVHRLQLEARNAVQAL